MPTVLKIIRCAELYHVIGKLPGLVN